MENERVVGDHRFTLKAEFSMHGHKDKIDWNLNWSDNIPERVADWIETNHQKGMDNWYQAEWTADQRRQADIEDRERDELARLKEKYEPKSE